MSDPMVCFDHHVMRTQVSMGAHEFHLGKCKQTGATVLSNHGMPADNSALHPTIISTQHWSRQLFDVTLNCHDMQGRESNDAQQLKTPSPTDTERYLTVGPDEQHQSTHQTHPYQ